MLRGKFIDKITVLEKDSRRNLDEFLLLSRLDCIRFGTVQIWVSLK